MSSLEEELTCSVCRDTFSRAHPLPCGHGFCPACIREAWGGGRVRRGGFSCVLCTEDHGEVPCDCCSTDGEGESERVAAAVKTCLRCEVSLCAEHLRPHMERPAFSSHLLVAPLGDLSQRRCPLHSEMFRYFCAEERVYLCGDCLLEGGHAQHNVKALKQVEADLKIILQSLLEKAEEKLRDGEQILKEHQSTDCAIVVSENLSHNANSEDSSEMDEAQVERLGSSLTVRVENLVGALRDITKREREQALERLQEDCSRVREDLSQTQSILNYLASLQAETDPVLLIWAFQTDDSQLLADLNCPLFTPDPLRLDRKYILDDIESKYREFITETLRCLSELKRELCTLRTAFPMSPPTPLQRDTSTLMMVTCPLTLDTNTAHPLLSISDDLRSATRVKTRLPCAAHPERFDHWAQVLSIQAFSSGTHYWELEAEGFWDIGVCYRSIGRKGKEGNAFGNNKVSWSLTQQHDRKLAAWHNCRKTRLSGQMTGNRVGVALDYGAGTITFSEVGPSGNLTHLHTFYTTFTQPVCLGFGLYKVELNSRISIMKV